jgi:hypothetical protein
MERNNNRLTPMKAIRKHCLECGEGTPMDVKACPIYKCRLWKFRLGRRPFSEKNSKNPFLQEQNYVGREDWSASKLINYLKELEDG